MLGADAFFLNQRNQIAALAARYAIPAITQWREYPAAGGLMSYGNSIPDAYRLMGVYVGRILREKNRPIFQFSSRPSSTW